MTHPRKVLSQAGLEPRIFRSRGGRLKPLGQRGCQLTLHCFYSTNINKRISSFSLCLQRLDSLSYLLKERAKSSVPVRAPVWSFRDVVLQTCLCISESSRHEATSLLCFCCSFRLCGHEGEKGRGEFFFCLFFLNRINK